MDEYLVSAEQAYEQRDVCNHTLDEGCFRCCERCDTDNHICLGCGEPLYHGKSECSSCADEQYELSRQNVEGV